MSFPFLVSRDYSYKQALEIKMSSELTSTGRPYHFEDRSSSYFGKKDTYARKQLNTPYDFAQLDFMCRPDQNHGHFEYGKSHVAGLVSNSNEVMSSPYEVDLYYALYAADEESDRPLSGPGVPHCYQLCQKEWTKE